MELARDLADDVFFPVANDVDAAEIVPRSHLDRLASAGLYGLTAPVDKGGLGLAGPPAWKVIETLAGGCLATTFVWLQHLSVAAALSQLDTSLATELVGPMCAGEVRAGIALGGACSTPSLLASRVSGGWRLDGHSPWVTGWGLIDLVHVAARTDDDLVFWGMVDGRESSTLSAHRLNLSAVNASATVTLVFDDHFLPDARCTFNIPYEQWQQIDAGGLRANGSLALWVTGRCLAILDSAEGRQDLDSLRIDLDGASPEEMPKLRARASEMSLRAAASVLVHRGSHALLTRQDGERLLREAGFLLVFGSRPAIKSSLLAELVGGHR